MHFTGSLIDLWKGVALNRLRHHPEDERLLGTASHRLRLDRVPEPWFGSPSKAKVFYLTLNPGHASDEDGTLGDVWGDFCYDMLRDKISSDRYLNEAPTSAIQWLRKAHGSYAQLAFDQICNLRLLAYPSVDANSFGKLSSRITELPTVQKTKDFVHRELVPRAKRNELALLVLRGAKAWGFQTGGEDIEEGSLFISKPIRSVSLTPASRVGPIIDRCLATRVKDLKQEVQHNGHPPQLSSVSPKGVEAGNRRTVTVTPPSAVLRGESTPDLINRYRHRVPGARIRKLRSDSCTFVMPRRDSYRGGPRYRIFEFLDNEPHLSDAVEFARRQGMAINGSKAYWDILEALRHGFIEIVGGSNVNPE